MRRATQPKFDQRAVQLAGRSVAIDTVIAPAERDEDRLAVHVEDDYLLVALADGAGGMSCGAEAADAIVALASSVGEGDVAAALDRVDRELAARRSGEAASVVLRVRASPHSPGLGHVEARALATRARGVFGAMRSSRSPPASGASPSSGPDAPRRSRSPSTVSEPCWW